MGVLNRLFPHMVSFSEIREAGQLATSKIAKQAVNDCRWNTIFYYLMAVVYCFMVALLVCAGVSNLFIQIPAFTIFIVCMSVVAFISCVLTVLISRWSFDVLSHEKIPLKERVQALDMQTSVKCVNGDICFMSWNPASETYVAEPIYGDVVLKGYNDFTYVSGMTENGAKTVLIAKPEKLLRSELDLR